MSEEAPSVKQNSVGKLFVPSLIITTFAVGLSGPMLSLLSLDMAQTFFGSVEPAALGAVAQIGTVNSATEVLFALLMGVLTVRFRSRPLLLLGVVFLFVSAIGSFFAPNLPLLQFFYALEGGGTVIVGITAFTLVGELVVSQKKPKVVSYMIAVGYLATLVGTPLIGVITNFGGGWRFNFLWLVLPFSVAGLIMAYLGLPSKTHEKSVTSKESYLTAFKQVLKNKSAASCLLAGMCGSAGNVAVFALAFYRQQFLSNLPVPEQINFVVLILMVACAMVVVASLVMGRIMNRIGLVKLTVMGAVGNSVFTILFFFMPNLWIAVTLDMTHVWFFAAAATTWSCLTLDQVPAFRGTMMSLRTIFMSIGYGIATAIGGAALALFGSYQAVGFALGIMIIPSAVLTYFYTKDPNKATVCS